MDPLSHAGNHLPNPEGQALRGANGPPLTTTEKHLPVPIADHELLRCIGRGSYGQVWLARNLMGAYRAVKIVYRNSFENQRPFERELSGIRRFEPISRSHEGFVDVLQVGINQEQGYFYYVMELGDDHVSGQTIDPGKYVPKTLAGQISNGRKMSLQECLQLGLALSQALSELHKHGLVHRDIKPSNIIFVTGVPKLADIGLVTSANEARSYVGTEGFIPPEGPGTAQADIYSFGKVLYEASTGKDRQDFPEMPTHWSESSEYQGLLELNEIILQACNQDPAKRYASTWDLQADLVVVLNGKSVKRLRLLERRMANLKRTVGVIGLILAVSGLVIYEVYREWRAATEARQRQVSANITYGNRSMEAGDLLGALPYFAEALRLDHGNRNQETTHRLRFGATLAQCPKLTQLFLAGTRVNDGEVSPDGKWVLFADYFGKAEVHSTESGDLYSQPFGPKRGLVGAAYSPDGSRIVTASEDSNAKVWDAQTLSEVLHLPHTNRVFNARFSPDGHRIATSCLDGIARVWDARTGRLELLLQGHTGAVAFATFSHDGNLIATASHDGTARVWNAVDGKPTGLSFVHGDWVTWVSFSLDDQRLVTACNDHAARVWDLSTGKKVLPELEHNDTVRTAEYSPDGRLILTASFDGTARLWRAEDLQPLGSNPVLRHGERLTHAGFSRDGRCVITTCIDGAVRIWDLAGSRTASTPQRRVFSRDASRYLTVTVGQIRVWESHSGNVVSPLIDPPSVLEKAELTYDGRFVLTVSGLATTPSQTNHFVQVWNAETGQTIGPGISVANSFGGTAPSDDGRYVVIWGGKSAQAWNTLAATAISPPLPHVQAVNSAGFDPQASRIVTLCGTNAFVWDTLTGRLAYPPLHHPVPVSYFEFSRDGRKLVTCCSDPNLTKCFAQIWGARDGRAVGDPLNHADGVLFASFSRDGSRIVTASEDFSARVWETATGGQIGLPLKHRHQVPAAALSSDARWVATASVDKTARVWEVDSNDPLTPPFNHLAGLSDVKFLPDNRQIVTSDREGRSWIWDLPVDTRPVADLTALAQFLSGGELLPTRKTAQRLPETLDHLWRRLRAKYPRDFSASSEEIVAWHEFQAEDSELREQWFAAVFHLEHLLSLNPGDESLTRRLSLSKERLRRSN